MTLMRRAASDTCVGGRFVLRPDVREMWGTQDCPLGAPNETALTIIRAVIAWATDPAGQRIHRLCLATSSRHRPHSTAQFTQACADDFTCGGHVDESPCSIAVIESRIAPK